MRLHFKNNAQGTVVPNRFIENCTGAPEKYIAAYLLGLMYAEKNQQIEFGMFCARIGIGENDMIDAFEYWQKRGFAHIINSSELCFEFGDFTDQTEDSLYTERVFNQKLQKIFGSRPALAHEYLKIYDYTDTFGLSKSVVLTLAEYCVLKKGRRVSVAYMDKIAKSWPKTSTSTRKTKHAIRSRRMASPRLVSSASSNGLASHAARPKTRSCFSRSGQTPGASRWRPCSPHAHTLHPQESPA